MRRSICDMGAENLVEAIVYMATKDWEASIRKKKPGDPESRMQRDCERFFRSAYFTRLTGMDGKLILRDMQEKNPRIGRRTRRK